MERKSNESTVTSLLMSCANPPFFMICEPVSLGLKALALRESGRRELGKAAREIFIPDLRLGSGIMPREPVEEIKVRTRDFR